MPLYESTFVTRQDVSRADVGKLIEQFTDIVKQQGGSVIKHEYWGLRNLAYKIKKNRKGHYVMLAIEAPHAAIKELERNIHLHEDVIRSLTVHVDSIDENPSPIMQKTSRDEESVPQAESPSAEGGPALEGAA